APMFGAVAGGGSAPTTIGACGLGSVRPAAVTNTKAFSCKPLSTPVPAARLTPGAVVGAAPGPTSVPPAAGSMLSYVTCSDCAPSGVVAAMASPDGGNCDPSSMGISVSPAARSD